MHEKFTDKYIKDLTGEFIDEFFLLKYSRVSGRVTSFCLIPVQKLAGPLWICLSLV